MDPLLLLSLAHSLALTLSHSPRGEAAKGGGRVWGAQPPSKIRRGEAAKGGSGDHPTSWPQRWSTTISTSWCLRHLLWHHIHFLRMISDFAQKTSCNHRIHWLRVISEFAQTTGLKTNFGLKLGSEDSVGAHIRNRRDDFSGRVCLWGVRSPPRTFKVIFSRFDFFYTWKMIMLILQQSTCNWNLPKRLA